MSIRVMSWVWEHSKARGTERLLLLAIADAADDTGRNAFPSVATLARRVVMSPRSVQRLTAKLEAAGLVKVERNTGRGSNRYTVVMSEATSLDPAGHSYDAGADTSSSVPQQSQQARTESTGGVRLTPRQSDTGDTATTPQGRHSYDTPEVTQLCRPTPPVTVLYPSTADAAELDDGGGGQDELADQRPDVVDVLAQLGPRWRIGATSAARLRPAVAQALANGWTVDELVQHLDANPDGVRNPYAVLAARLADLPAPPPRRPARTAWCGTCHEQTRLRDTDAGVTRCPECHPSATRSNVQELHPKRKANPA